MCIRDRVESSSIPHISAVQISTPPNKPIEKTCIKVLQQKLTPETPTGIIEILRLQKETKDYKITE